MIGVLGATGIIGVEVVAALEKREAAFICIVRNPEDARAKLGNDVELTYGDYSEPESLGRAFAGLDRLFFLSAVDPFLERWETNAIQAAKQAGITYVVETSSVAECVVPDSPCELMRMHYNVEQSVKSSGMNYAVSHPNFFMSNISGMVAGVASTGRFTTTLSEDVMVSMVHPTDVGEASAELITDGDRANQAYALTGPLTTMGEVVDLVSRAVGKDIEYAQMTAESARSAMRKTGRTEWSIETYLSMMELCAQGRMAKITDWVGQLTGHRPRTVADWINDHAEIFRS